MRLSTRLLTALAALAFSVTAAHAQVVVSSKIDTEGGVIGNIILQVLKANNIPVTDKIQLGNTKVVRSAITAGQIDIYPEYTGNGAFFFNEADKPIWNDAQKGYEEVKKLDYDQNKIVWLDPAPANNTWDIALRKEIADANHIATWSDFGKWVSGGGQVKLAASAEFVSSPAALPAFEKTYGFTLKPDQLITLSGGDTAAFIAAAANQTSGANAAVVYGTDGGIEPSGLVALEDDKGVQPVYNPAPIIREPVLKQYPQIADLLKPVFAKLDMKTLQTLNGRVQVGGEAASAVATDWLKQQGILK
ncbi:MAG: glycine betaine ABC transporter substrate-binding protein OsmF [Devosia sp.]|jgi:osmoprotectant transport system substrate-binding protein|nr:ABC transporter substrate-binding protein [Devosiaceae bacterium]